MDKQYLKQVMIYAAVSLIAIAVMIYVGYHMVSSFTSGVETQPAYLDRFNESVMADAYILRREEVLYSNAAGVVNYLVSDGEKVAVGDEVADIYRSGGDVLRERIEKIDEAIEALTAVEARAKYLSVSDVNKIDTEIEALVLAARTQTAGNDLSAASASTNEIEELMNLRRLVTGEVESYESEIGSLRAERASIVAQLADISETIRSEHSAYYFHEVDGYEGAFAFEDIDTLTLDDIQTMISAQPKPLSGYEAGKLVRDYMWYVAVPTDEATLSYFTVGRSYNLEFGAEGKSLSMKLYSVLADTSEATDDACLIFVTSEMPSGFEYSRMQPVSIDAKTYEGYRVPLSAVRVVKYGDVEVAGVYVLYGNTVVFRRIDIILQQDGYVLCRAEEEEEEDDGYVDFPMIGGETETEPPEEYETIPFLALYDLVITSSKGLYDGKIVAE